MFSSASLPLQDRNLSLTVASADPLEVRSFSVVERISSLFAVTVEAVSANPALEFDAIVGKPARFILRAGLCERLWTGLCSRLLQTRVEETGLSTSCFKVCMP